MTIEKARPWGTPITVPEGFLVVSSDAELARLPGGTPLSVTGGDVHRAIGAPTAVAPGQTRTLVEVDALTCVISTTQDRVEMLAASAIEIGRWLSIPPRRRRYVCVTNAGVLRGLDVAPRAHPNDGHFDVLSLEARTKPIQRVMARRRARTGDHLPHPDISVRRSTSVRFVRTHPGEALFVDGRRIKDWEEIEIGVAVDYWRVIV